MRERIVSFMLVGAMLVSLLVVFAYGVQPDDGSTAVFSAAAGDDYYKKQKEMALKGKDVLEAWQVINYSCYDYYMNRYVSPYHSPIKTRRESPVYQTLLNSWRVATLGATSEVELAEKETAYYTSYLYNLLLDETSESMLGNFADDMSSAVSVWKSNSKQLGASAWKKLAKTAGEFLKDGETLSASTEIPASEEGKTALAQQLGALPEIETVTGLLSDIEKLMGYANTVFELVEKLAQVEAVMNVTKEAADIMADMSRSVTGVSSLNDALNEVSTYASGVLTEAEIMACLIGQTTVIELSKYVLGEMQKAIVAQCGLCGLAVETAQSVGKLICSTLFNTDKAMASYYSLNALYELEDLLKSKVQSYQWAFEDNPTVGNAKRFNTAYRMLYKLYIEGIDGYLTFLEENYRNGALNDIWSNLSEETYTFIVKCQNELKESLRDTLKYADRNAAEEYYAVLQQIDPDASGIFDMQPVKPPFTQGENEALLDEVEQYARLCADMVIDGDTTLATDIDTYGRLIVKSGTLDLAGHKIIIKGNAEQTGGSINLNGGELTVEGDFLQSDGKMLCNKGTLNVNGDYRIQSKSTDEVGAVTYNDSNGVLRMTTDMDKVNVTGDFVMQSYYATSTTDSNRNCFSAGTLTVKGDFSQLYGSYGNFAASGTHKVVLDGDGVQTVTFENGESNINELVITKPLETGYIFDPNPCWNKITQLGSGTIRGSVHLRSNETSGKPITIRLLKEDSELQCIVVYDGLFAISGLPDGVYGMEFIASGFVMYKCVIEVKKENTTPNLDITLIKRGNINGMSSGTEDVDAADMQCLYELLSTGTYTGQIADANYQKAVVDVNSDGEINILDYQALYMLISA